MHTPPKGDGPPSPAARFSSSQTGPLHNETDAAIMAVEREKDDVYSAEIATLNLDLLAAAKPSKRTPMTEAACAKLDYHPDGLRALYIHRSSLTPFEMIEIQEYPAVYFVGPKALKINLIGPKSEDPNDSFDDAEGVYKYIVNDHIDYRYELLKRLGTGAFGQVYKVYDHKEQRTVALKLLKNTEKAVKLGVAETEMLEILGELDYKRQANFITLFRSFHFRNHMVLVLDLCAMDLYSLISKRKDPTTGLSMPTVRKFGLGLLRCLKFLAEQNVIHCDLKLENILLVDASRTGIKVCDFNTSCFSYQTIYSYLQSRYYRCPEVIMRIRNQKYDCPVDMWSLGCILAELATGQILFPGGNEPDMMALFMEMLGQPPAALLKHCTAAQLYVHSSGRPMYCTAETDERGKAAPATAGSILHKRHRDVPGSKSLARFLKMAENAPFVDFVRKCLEWEPETRLTPSRALAHPWILNLNPMTK